MSCCDTETKTLSLLALAFSGHRKWLLLSAVIVAVSLALGWEKLAVAGLAPVLVTLLPCAIVCALGLGALKKASK